MCLKRGQVSLQVCGKLSISNSRDQIKITQFNCDCQGITRHKNALRFYISVDDSSVMLLKHFQPEVSKMCCL